MFRARSGGSEPLAPHVDDGRDGRLHRHERDEHRGRREDRRPGEVGPDHLQVGQSERRWEFPKLPGERGDEEPSDERRQDRRDPRAERALAHEVCDERRAYHQRNLGRDPHAVLRRAQRGEDVGDEGHHGARDQAVHDRCGEPLGDPIGQSEDRRCEYDSAGHHRGSDELGEAEPISERCEEDDREDVPGDQERLAKADGHRESDERRQAVEHRDPSARLGVREVETMRTGSREDDAEHREVHDRDRDGGDQRWQRSAELPRTSRPRLPSRLLGSPRS